MSGRNSVVSTCGFSIFAGRAAAAVYLDTVEVTGSIPVSRTILLPVGGVANDFGGPSTGACSVDRDSTPGRAANLGSTRPPVSGADRTAERRTGEVIRAGPVARTDKAADASSSRCAIPAAQPEWRGVRPAAAAPRQGARATRSGSIVARTDNGDRRDRWKLRAGVRSSGPSRTWIGAGGGSVVRCCGERPGQKRFSLFVPYPLVARRGGVDRSSAASRRCELG